MISHPWHLSLVLHTESINIFHYFPFKIYAEPDHFPLPPLLLPGQATVISFLNYCSNLPTDLSTCTLFIHSMYIEISEDKSVSYSNPHTTQKKGSPCWHPCCALHVPPLPFLRGLCLELFVSRCPHRWRLSKPLQIFKSVWSSHWGLSGTYPLPSSLLIFISLFCFLFRLLITIWYYVTF